MKYPLYFFLIFSISGKNEKFLEMNFSFIEILKIKKDILSIS